MIGRLWHRFPVECAHRLGFPFTPIDDPPFPSKKLNRYLSQVLCLI